MAKGIVDQQRGDDCLGLAFYMYAINTKLYEHLKPSMVDTFMRSGHSCSTSEQAGHLGLQDEKAPERNIARKYLNNFDKDFITKVFIRDNITSFEKLKRILGNTPAVVSFHFEKTAHALVYLKGPKFQSVFLDSNSAQHGERNEMVFNQLIGPQYENFAGKLRAVLVSRIYRLNPKVSITAPQLAAFEAIRKDQMHSLAKQWFHTPNTRLKILSKRNLESVEKAITKVNFYLRFLERAKDSPYAPIPRLERLISLLNQEGKGGDLKIMYDQLLKYQHMIKQEYAGDSVPFHKKDLYDTRRLLLDGIIMLLKRI